MEPIPGLHLVLDYSSGTAYLSEPLHDDQHKSIKAKLEAKGFSIAETKEFPSVDVATWSHWMQSAVDAGCARIVKGDFQLVDGTPKTSFIVDRKKGPIERLTEALEKQTDMLGKVLAKLG